MLQKKIKLDVWRVSCVFIDGVPRALAITLVYWKEENQGPFFY